MILKSLVILLGLIVIGAVLYVRFAPSNPARWHVDPMTARLPKTPNAFLQRPDEGKYPSIEFHMDAITLARAFDTMVLSTPHTHRLAGDPEALFVTYIARTPLMRFPDYVSIRFIDIGQGRATYAVFSRARFGYSDGGINRKRLFRWLKKLPQATE